MPGRLRTASRPSRTVMSCAAYDPFCLRAVLLLGLLRQLVPSISWARGWRPTPQARRRPPLRAGVAPADYHEKPRLGPLSGRVGAVHKTALDTSRLPLCPDGCAGYKIPANRNKLVPCDYWFGGEPMVKRNFFTEPAAGRPDSPASASPKRVSKSGPRSSSSCAQTADSQATVTTPSRSETGVADAARPGPATSAQTACTRASRVVGSAPRTTSSRATDRARGASRLTRPPRALRRAPSRPRPESAQPVDSAVPGTCSVSVVVTTA